MLCKSYSIQNTAAFSDISCIFVFLWHSLTSSDDVRPRIQQEFFFIGGNSGFPEVWEGGAQREKKFALQLVEILCVTINVHFRTFLWCFHY